MNTEPSSLDDSGSNRKNLNHIIGRIATVWFYIQIRKWYNSTRFKIPHIFNSTWHRLKCSPQKVRLIICNFSLFFLMYKCRTVRFLIYFIDIEGGSQDLPGYLKVLYHKHWTRFGTLESTWFPDVPIRSLKASHMRAHFYQHKLVLYRGALVGQEINLSRQKSSSDTTQICLL